LSKVNPEQLARRHIDRMLEQCGWIVQDFADMNIAAGPGVAIREFPLKTGFADYLLYVHDKALGVVEAKPEGHSLKGVETQSAKYIGGLPRANLRHMPPLDTSKLWDKQVTAISNLEKSLAADHPRSLIQMAMGAGKTFTACNIAYRLIKHGQARRVCSWSIATTSAARRSRSSSSYTTPTTSRKFSEECRRHQPHPEHDRPRPPRRHHHHPAAVLHPPGRA
jgi:type I restriction enzyme R subunit